MGIEGVRKGDKVFVVHRDRWNGRGKEPTCQWLEVTSAGHKYVTTNDPQRTRFHRSSGFEKTDYTPSQKAYASEEEYREERERWQLEDSFRQLSQNVRPGSLTATQLQQLISILSEPRP